MLVAALTVIFCGVLVPHADAGRVTAIKQNVLMIIIDDLRPALGVYNDKNAYTPNIDNLASRSFVFQNAYAQQALCAPSRNSLLTSRRPDSLRLYDFYSYWRETVGSFTTLPQLFKENGYRTHSVGKVFHPGASSNFSDDMPYSWSQPPFHPKTEGYKNAKVCLGQDATFCSNVVCPLRVADQPGGILPDMESLREAVRFLDESKVEPGTTKKPFFLAVGFHKPHIPLKYPRKFLKYHPLEKITLPMNIYRPSILPNVAWNPWNDIRERQDVASLNISFPFGNMPPKYTKRIVQSYAAAVTYIDSLIGDLLKHVDNNTVIVLLGDHGVSLGEHGEFSKYSNFEVATRVPLIIHSNHLINGMIVSKKLVELVDVFPTIVDLTAVTNCMERCSKNGSNARLCTEGRSLVPHMYDLLEVAVKTDDREDVVFWQYPRPGDFPTINPDSDKPKLKEITIMGYSIRTVDFRYTEWVAFDNCHFTANWTHVYGRELYSLHLDPNENMNLADKVDLVPIMANLRNRLIIGWRCR